MARRRKDNRGGFTLVETLVTVAITAILLAVAVVGVGMYRSRLQLTELDNAAREIYMAAQNRATLLSGRDALDQLAKKADDANKISSGGGVDYYYITNTAGTGGAVDDTTLEQLLPTGSVDPSLREGYFYIVYEPSSGSVTDVFYTEEAPATGSDLLEFPGFYQAHNYDKSDFRRKHEPMVGWYSAAPGESGKAFYLPPVELKPFNEDTLRAEITWRVPQSLSDKDIKLHVYVTCKDADGNDIVSEDIAQSRNILSANDGFDREGNIIHRDVILLDSLQEDLQFKDITFIGGKPRPGSDFTLQASVSYDGDDVLVVPAAAAPWTDNSLFAYNTAGTETARINYLRHLQNLSADWSSVEGVTAAEQGDNIEKPSEGTGYILADVIKYDPAPDYIFQPIRNAVLESYDGGDESYEIQYLNIAARTSVYNEAGAGLFLSLTGSSSTDRKSLSNIRLMNATVNLPDAAGNTAPLAGTLCAQAENVNVTNCQAYWRPDGPAQSSLRNLLNDADDTYALSDGAYKLSGTTAGGLIGKAENVKMELCSASTTIHGTTVGGLVGSGSGLTINSSYADCYLKGMNAAGLVGSLGTGSSFTSVYAAGFSHVESGRSAGLYLGAAADVSDSYAAMEYYYETGNMLTVYPIGENAGTYKDVHYLTPIQAASIIHEVSGEKECDSNGLSKLTLTGFESKLAAVSHAYNLQESLALGRYPYPGLPDLEHYGDWPDVLRVNSLVYWEQYKNGDSSIVTGIWGGNKKTVKTATKDERPIVTKDGYAVLLDKSALSEGSSSATITFTLDGKEIKTTYGDGGTSFLTYMDGGTAYYLAPLPAELVDIGKLPASSDIYRLLQIEVEITNGSSTQKGTASYWYVPHFATPPVESTSSTVPTAPRLNIRSGRHLYDLAADRQYYSGSTTNNFLQQLDIDYGAYSWDGGVPALSPIGRSAADAFTGTYVGTVTDLSIAPDERVDLTIRNVPLDVSGTYIGLFGYNRGVIQNVVFEGGGYKCAIKDNKLDVTANSADKDPLALTVVAKDRLNNKYVGGLCAYNEAVITGCSASNITIQIDASNYSTVWAGGLAAVNNNQIRSSSAANILSLNATSSYGYVGGFVGQNTSGSTIVGCYSVGLATAVTSDLTGGTAASSNPTVNVAGFCASSGGRGIQGCYSAVGLTAGGSSAYRYEFCPDRVSSCYYLSGGNFEFVQENGKRTAFTTDQRTTASDPLDYAQPKSWTEMTDVDSVILSSSVYFQASGIPDTEPGHHFPVVVGIGAQKQHFGGYATPLELDSLGVFYWEHETGGTHNGYFMSYLYISNDPVTSEKSVVRGDDLLCHTHGGSGYIDQFGYGYFWAGDTEPGFNTLDANGIATTYFDPDQDPKNDPTDPTDPGRPLYQSNETVANELSRLMAGKYHFKVFTTATKKMETGLLATPQMYPTGTYKDKDNEDAPNANSIWNLTVTESEGPVIYSFEISPLFANAMEVTQKTLTEQHISNDTYQYQALGTDRPYGVRSIEQLQYINWNVSTDTIQNTITGEPPKTFTPSFTTDFTTDRRTITHTNGNKEDGVPDATNTKFPYLSYVKYLYSDNSHAKNGVVKDRIFSWKQSHDLNGQVAEEQYATFHPIAAFVDTIGMGTVSGGDLYTQLPGWFGGSYDGDNYMIRNIDIFLTGSSRDTMKYDDAHEKVIENTDEAKGNVVGLFGVTRNAGLRGIVMRSDAGKNLIVMQNKSMKNAYPTDSNLKQSYEHAWYAAGGLVGIAIQDDSGSSDRIENCAIAGFTVVDATENSNVGGGAVGGLVGVCNMELSHCSSDVDIEINGKGNSNGGAGTRNLRVGGMAGTVQRDERETGISSCYAGGSIKLGNYKATLYVGGISGGCYMRQMDLDGDHKKDIETTKGNAIICKNSYSFVDIYKIEKIGGKYAIAGPGEPLGYSIECVNCYYLKERAGKINNIKDLTGSDKLPKELTYEQLSNEEPVNTILDGEGNVERYEYIYDLLTEDMGWYPVTTSAGAGHYSYPSSSSLAGLDFPFPTVLTSEDDQGDLVHVHYGNWPLNGLQREFNGPIQLDLFADYDPNAKVDIVATADWPAETWTEGPWAALTETDLDGAAIYNEETITVTDLLKRTMGTYSGKFLPIGPEDISFSPVAGEDTPAPVCFAYLIPDPADLYTATLNVVGLTQGSATITVSYQYGDEPGAVAKKDITVDVTAQLLLLPAVIDAPEAPPAVGVPDEGSEYTVSGDTVVAFPGLNGKMDLYPFNLESKLISTALMEDVDLLLTGFDAGEYLSAVQETEKNTADHVAATIELAGSRTVDAPQPLTVLYTYEYRGTLYTSSSTLIYEVHDRTVETDTAIFIKADETGFVPSSYTFTSDDIRLSTDYIPDYGFKDVTITNAYAWPDASVAKVDYADGTATLTPKPSSGAYNAENFSVDVSFTYGQCRFQTTIYPSVAAYDLTTASGNSILTFTNGSGTPISSVTIGAQGTSAASVSGPAPAELPPSAEPAESAPDEAGFDAPIAPASLDTEPEPVALASLEPLEPAAFVPEGDPGYTDPTWDTPNTPEPSVYSAAAIPDGATPVRLRQLLGKDWTVTWTLEETLSAHLDKVDDGAAAYLSVKDPESITDPVTGKLTVTVTTDVTNSSGSYIILRGEIPVTIQPGVVQADTPPEETPSGDDPSAADPPVMDGMTPEPPGIFDDPANPMETPAPVETPAPTPDPTPEPTAPPAEEPPYQEPEWQEPEWQEPAPQEPDFVEDPGPAPPVESEPFYPEEPW